MPEFDLPSVIVVHSSARSGLMVENITSQLAEFFGVKSGQGVLVRSVEKGSHAEKAGLKAGDVIIRINEEKIADVSDFSHALRSRKNNNVTIGIIRDKREQNLSVTMPERKQSELLDESWEAPAVTAEMREAFVRLNSEMATLKPQLALAMAQARSVQQGEMKKQLCKMKQQAEKMKQDSLRKMQRELILQFDDLI